MTKNELEIEEMVAGLASWEKEARRIVYRFMDGEPNPNFLATKITCAPEGFRGSKKSMCPTTIREYCDYMEAEALQDEAMGFNASFAIDFIRVAKAEEGEN